MSAYKCPKCGGLNKVTETETDPFIDMYGNVNMSGTHTTTVCTVCKHRDTWVSGVYSSSNPKHQRFNQPNGDN